jgi:chemosensory pili system protein ChpA (sensor histidine kinase/response regulator)
MNSDTGPLVMVIDDDADIREMIKVLLEVDGYRVVTAIDGVDAMEKLSTGEEPALILIDLMMPRMDGEQFIVALRRSGRTKVPVIVMSGHSVSGKRSDKFLGHPCLIKPVEIDDLMAVVRRFAGHGISRTTPRRRRA